MKTIEEQIRGITEHKDFTSFRDLSRLTEMNATTLWRQCNGTTAIKLDTVEALSRLGFIEVGEEKIKEKTVTKLVRERLNIGEEEMAKLRKACNIYLTVYGDQSIVSILQRLNAHI